MAGVKQRAFDPESFANDLTALRERHGVLAIVGHVMIPLGADHHHVFRAENGLTQLHIDQLEISARHPGYPLLTRVPQ